MTLRSEIKSMEIRREQLLDEIHADMNQVGQKLRESVAPAALMKKHPIGILATTVLAGMAFGRGAGRRGSRTTSTVGEPPGEAASAGPKRPLARLVDFAIRSGAVEMLAAVPWRDLPGMFRSQKHHQPGDVSAASAVSAGRSGEENPETPIK